MQEAEPKRKQKPKRPNYLDLAGWRRRPDVNSAYQYKILLCMPETREPQEIWLTPKEVTLEWMQKQVGGNIDTIQAIDADVPDDTLIGVLNEDGIGLQLPRNKLVAEWMVDIDQPYYGPALIMPAKLMF